MSPDAEPATGTIIRTVKDRSHPYVVINRAVFEDDRLSWEARGLLGYLLSKPDGWQIRIGDLIQRGPGGRDRLRRMLHELQAAGYLQRQRFQEPGGLFVWISLIYETPPSTPFQAMVPEKASPSTPLPSTAEPSTAEPSTAKASIYLIRNEVSTESVSNEREREAAPAPTPSPPAFLSFAPNDDAHRWWARECQAASVDPTTIPLEPETARWRDEIAAGRRAVPVDPAADWRQWMRRAISWAHAHPPKEGVGSHGTDVRPAGPGARPPGQPDPEPPVSDEQYRDQLATTLRGILVPPEP